MQKLLLLEASIEAQVNAGTEVGLVVRTIYCCEDKEPKIPSP